MSPQMVFITVPQFLLAKEVFCAIYQQRGRIFHVYTSKVDGSIFHVLLYHSSARPIFFTDPLYCTLYFGGWTSAPCHGCRLSCPSGPVEGADGYGPTGSNAGAVSFGGWLRRVIGRFSWEFMDHLTYLYIYINPHSTD